MGESFLPYARQWIDEHDIKAVTIILESDWITSGPKIKEFEDSVCRYISCKYGVAVNSGTSALDIAVASLGLKDSEVVTTPFTFAATTNCVLYNNLTPIFADIERATRNINPEEIRKRITDKTKAVIYVDYAGQPCNIKEIREIADENGLYLIEDAAHALGAEYNGKKVGNLADITIFSFHPVKHITTGEGGMCVTDNEKLAEKMRMLRNHGIDRGIEKRLKSNSWEYDIDHLGRNYRITDFQCALGISQLKKLDKFLSKREQISKRYNEAFKNISEIETPSIKSNVRHAWHLYTILLNGINRDKFFEEMRDLNIGVNVHYIPVYRFSYHKRLLRIDEKEFPVTEDVFRRIVTLPLFPEMSNENIDYVIDSTIKSIRKLR